MSKMLQRADELAGRVRPERFKDRRPTDREQEEHLRQRDLFEKARGAVADLCKVLNGGGQQEKRTIVAGILEGLTHEHRYLQNEALWLLLTSLGAFGGLPSGRFTDARNEHAHKACADLREALGDRIYWPDWE